MIITGHQPNYWPYPGFFHKILHSDAFVVVDTTQFVKRGPFGWIHRNRIKTSSEKGWNWLTVPVLTKGKYEQAINETKINNQVKWRGKHLRAIELNYSKAPFFEDFADELKELYDCSYEMLSDLTNRTVELSMKRLGLEVPVYRTSELGVEGVGGELIVEFCRTLGADGYVSGVHGRDYLDFELFERAGIELYFPEYEALEYEQQFGEEFMPNLSILDMLLNSGGEGGRRILEKSGGLKGR